MTACIPFDGPELAWRERAAQRCWIELGLDQPMLFWPRPDCGTSLCLNLEHLVWESPKALNYPGGICVYCGVIASTEDHLLPRTWTGEAVRRHVLTVPACQPCNSTLNDRYVPSITARRRLAHEYIARKNKALLRMPDWNNESLAELGVTLRSFIERSVFDRKLVLARLAWPEDIDYDLRAMHTSGIKNPYELGLLEEGGYVNAA